MRKCAIVFVTLSMLAAAGCKKKEGTKPEPKPTEQSVEPTKEEPAKPDPAPPVSAPPPAAAGASTGMPQCDAYIAAVDAYMKCDKVPQAARDSAKQGIEAMRQGWSDMTGVPDHVKKQTDEACKQGVDALRQGAASMGCKI